MCFYAVFCFRAVTMFITVLPKPDESYVCAAKMEDMTPYGKVKTKTKF